MSESNGSTASATANGAAATATAVPATSRKDWTSDQEVRWCPGCGDYSILAAVQMLMPDLGVRRENTVFSRATPRSGMVRCTAFRIA